MVRLVPTLMVSQHHMDLPFSSSSINYHGTEYMQSENDIPPRNLNDGNMESEPSEMPSTQWSPSDPVFGEQDRSHLPKAFCLEPTYSYGRRQISEVFSKDTNGTENFLTSEAHTIPGNSTSTTQAGGWAGMLSHESHHSGLFAQEHFVNSGLDLNHTVSIRYR